MYSVQNAILAEKRKFERFIAKDRAFVLISPNSNPVHIIDISKSGIAFKYLGKELMNVQAEEFELYYEEELCLESIPFEIVSDELIQMSRYISLRRCGIKFGKLTSTQETFINDFITRYTQ